MCGGVGGTSCHDGGGTSCIDGGGGDVGGTSCHDGGGTSCIDGGGDVGGTSCHDGGVVVMVVAAAGIALLCHPVPTVIVCYDAELQQYVCIMPFICINATQTYIYIYLCQKLYKTKL